VTVNSVTIVDAEAGALAAGGAVKVITTPEELKATIVGVNDLAGHVPPGFGVIDGGDPENCWLRFNAL
jgi:hypothetical protein